MKNTNFMERSFYTIAEKQTVVWLINERKATLEQKDNVSKV